jgi:hypothetical protein
MRMKIILVLASLCVAASAHASPARTALEPQSLPAQCRWAEVAPNAHIKRLVFAAKTSAADCSAIVALREATDSHTQAGAEALEAALAPSLALLDDTIANGALDSQIIATSAKADLLVGLDVYLAGSVSRVGTMTGADLAEYLRRIDQAHALAKAWRERGVAAYHDLDRLVHTNAGQGLAASNSVIMLIARDTTDSSSLR